MKRAILVGLAVVVMTLAAFAAIATGKAEADVGSPQCMTKAEWFKIKNGMTRAKVRQITGITGKVTNTSYYSDGTKSVDVDYRQCKRNGQPAPGSWNTVWISYDNYRYDRNWNLVRTGLQVDYKGSWSTPWVF
jgi:hypothetical protein